MCEASGVWRTMVEVGTELTIAQTSLGPSTMQPKRLNLTEERSDVCGSFDEIPTKVYYGSRDKVTFSKA